MVRWFIKKHIKSLISSTISSTISSIISSSQPRSDSSFGNWALVTRKVEIGCWSWSFDDGGGWSISSFISWWLVVDDGETDEMVDGETDEMVDWDDGWFSWW